MKQLPENIKHIPTTTIPVILKIKKADGTYVEIKGEKVIEKPKSHKKDKCFYCSKLTEKWIYYKDETKYVCPFHYDYLMDLIKLENENYG